MNLPTIFNLPRILRTSSIVFAFAFVQSCTHAGLAKTLDQVGDTYEIRLEQKSQNSGNGSSGSSSSRMTLIERVVELQPNGVVLEFDLPSDMSAQDRSIDWQFPARLLRRQDGSLELLNVDELETRASAWLSRAEIDPSACGKWLFTWTAVKIECDPQSAIGIVRPFDLRQDNLFDGAMYHEPGTSGPSPLASTPTESGGTVFKTELAVSSDDIRRQRAETDLIVAEMLNGAVPTLESALQSRSSEKYSGTMIIEIETDADGRVVRKTTNATVKTILEDGTVEENTTISNFSRELVSGMSIQNEPAK